MSNFYGATALTGGTTGCLDAIDGAGLNDLDGAFVITASAIYTYTLDVDSALAESSPDVIAPDTNAGDKRWILVSIRDFPDELKNLTTAEIQQLENIGSATISAAQWGYLGDANVQSDYMRIGNLQFCWGKNYGAIDSYDAGTVYTLSVSFPASFNANPVVITNFYHDHSTWHGNSVAKNIANSSFTLQLIPDYSGNNIGGVWIAIGTWK